MLDRLFQTAQAILNKEQMVYLRPHYFNLFVNNALNKSFRKLLSDVKTNTRKSNWMLDGRNLANYSDKVKEILEFYLTPLTITSTTPGVFGLNENIQFIEDIYSSNTTEVEKLDIQDFNLLRRNNYSPPTTCSPIAAKRGLDLLVLPNTINALNITYLRKPAYARWTFQEVNGKPMFDNTNPDFVNLDAPEILFDDILDYVLEMAGKAKRDPLVLQAVNQNQAEEAQIENRQ
mgnify:CR=1 FL=1